MISTTERLILKVVRDDSIPAFGAWHSCDDPQCPNNNVILLNLEAVFGPQVYEDGTPVEPLNSKECMEMLIETLMHEFGHALEQFFRLEFSEERLEKIVASYRDRRPAVRHGGGSMNPEEILKPFLSEDKTQRSELMSINHADGKLWATNARILVAWEQDVPECPSAINTPFVLADRFHGVLARGIFSDLVELDLSSLPMAICPTCGQDTATCAKVREFIQWGDGVYDRELLEKIATLPEVALSLRGEPPHSADMVHGTGFTWSHGRGVLMSLRHCDATYDATPAGARKEVAV